MSEHHDHGHSHGKNHIAEILAFKNIASKKLLWSLIITLAVMVLEFGGGYLSRSLALISDAWHMFSHAFAIAIGLIAAKIAQRPIGLHQTFGMFRAEILAAFINGLFLLLVVGIILYESIGRLLNPQAIISMQMLLVAIIGLAVNLVSMTILHGSQGKDINVRSVFMHLIADAASSIGVIVAAIVIHFTNWFFLDAAVSVGISVVILFWSIGILRDSGRILLEMAPAGLNSDVISEHLITAFPELLAIDHIHIWTITPDILAFTAHVQLEAEVEQWSLLCRLKKYLKDKFNIVEATIQVVPNGESDSCHLAT